MKVLYQDLVSLFVRYLIILVLGLGNLFIFYAIFTPITVYAVYSILSQFSPSLLIGTSILSNSKIISLVPACIAGAAYYLLIVLSLSVPKIPLTKRLLLIIFSSLIFLIFNIFRIVLLSSLLNFSYFNLIHKFLWYLLSTIFLVAIWFFCVKIFRIKSIPVYEDIKTLVKLIKKPKESKRKSKRN